MVADRVRGCGCGVGHAELSGELARAACAFSSEWELRRLYLRDPAVVAAVLRRPQVPSWLLSACLRASLEHLTRENDHMPPRPASVANRILDRGDVGVAQLRAVASFGNLATSTLAKVAAHPAADRSVLAALAVQLVWRSGIGLLHPGRAALAAAFGPAGELAVSFADGCRSLSVADAVREVRARLDDIAELGPGALELYATLRAESPSGDAGLLEVVAALASR